MSRCAPVHGNSSAAAPAACSACRYRSSPCSNTPSGISATGYSGGVANGVRSSSSARPRWSRTISSMSYTFAQVQFLTPIRQTIEIRATAQPDLRDVFLCHAWGDRQGPDKELLELLASVDVKFGSAKWTLASAFR